MGIKVDQSTQYIEFVQEFVLAVFSWVILLAVGVIISGKLAARIVRLDFRDEDHFTINLRILRIRAAGDEVSLGLAMYVLSFGTCAIFGGSHIYEFFKNRTGLDIGQWNSLSASASFFCIVITVLLTIVFAIAGQSKPAVSKRDRQAVVDRAGEIFNDAAANGEAAGD